MKLNNKPTFLYASQNVVGFYNKIFNIRRLINYPRKFICWPSLLPGMWRYPLNECEFCHYLPISMFTCWRMISNRRNMFTCWRMWMLTSWCWLCCMYISSWLCPEPRLSLLTLLPHLNGGSLRLFASSSPRFTSPSPYQRLDSTFRLLTTVYQPATNEKGT